MKPSSLRVLLKAAIIAAVLTFPLVQGHSTFVRIALNGHWQDPLRYIRNKTSPYDDVAVTVDYPSTLRLYNDPTWPIDRPESVRCGRDHMKHASKTDIMIVRAGDTISFAHQLYEPAEWTTAQFLDCPQGRGTCDDKGYTMGLFHDGPVVAHLSKVPEGQDVHTYDGSGEWVKVYTLGVRTRGSGDFQGPPFIWLPRNDGKLPPKFEFSIPPQTPSGEYRMTVSEDMHYGRAIDEDFTYPGGRIWDGEKFGLDKPVY
ncbi:hypothetical protein ANO14919_018540 [Xylariales sp. No.14919]|nr:hypothetical protein ANO14919_018540 [Xylariales sp. No.14919]